MFEKYLTKSGSLSSMQPQEVKNLWYITKFKKVHGNIYDYSQVVYQTTTLPVKVICSIHGVFHQSPNNHLSGSGCPKCRNNKKSLENCIQDFKAIHGNKYDYSSVKYLSSTSKVEIICNIHGSFYQEPGVHIKGHGCPNCQSTSTHLYLMYCNTTFLTKIGITNNVDRRLKDLKGSLTLIRAFKLDNPRKVESELHKKYKQFNEYNYTVISGNTEFYNLNSTQLQGIIQYLEDL